MKRATKVLALLLVAVLMTHAFSTLNVEAAQLGTPKLTVKRVNDGTGVKLTVKRASGADYYIVLMTGGESGTDESALERSIGYINDDQSLKYTYKIAWLPEGSYKFRVVAVSKDQQKTYSDSKTVKILGTNSDEKNPYDFSKVKVGDVIKFGNYEQDNNTKNGKEAIEWIVLEKKNTEILVISKYALDCQPFKSPIKDINTWEKSTIRTWLNETFLDSAFTKAEKSMINTKKIVTPDSKWGVSGGENTKDKIFLLSVEEVEETYNKVFSDDYDRRCVPTAYAIAQGVDTSSSYETKYEGNPCVWWLRSPGSYADYACYVLDCGRVDSDGFDVDYGDFSYINGYGVRPALWINLDS